MTTTVILYGNFPNGKNKELLQSIENKSGLENLDYKTDEGIILVGSQVRVQSAISLIAKHDLILPTDTDSRDIKVKKIKQLMREAKKEVFEKLIEGKPKCWGNLPWRFLTPRTVKHQMVSAIERMDLCLLCAENNPPIFQTCTAFSQLRVSHERKWMED